MQQVWTGERLETFIHNDLTTEHLHRYAIASTICKNLDVLDIASGEGYGSKILSMVANKVIGVDISKETVEHATKKYKSSNLTFMEGSASEIPLHANSIDIVVSFETLEHHDKHQEMMDEIKRVLKPNGVLIMSSPDKKNVAEFIGVVNHFHIKELYLEEFRDLINNNFKCAQFLFQKMFFGSIIVHEKLPATFCEYAGDYESIRIKKDLSPIYNLCIASDHELPVISSSLFDGKDIKLLQINMAVKHAVDKAVSIARSTWSYRIGHFLLYPLKIFRRV